jgi:hypothetical protein
MSKSHRSRDAIDEFVGIWLPFVDAYEAGLWIFWIGALEITAVSRPALRLAGDDLHCEDGPAVAWPHAARYWFWRGVQVPRKVIEAPDELQPYEISNERNVEVRRVMLERFGWERYLRESGAVLVQQDDYGKLWSLDFEDDEPLVMVEVENSTAEPDGSFKTYMLRVPPNIRTARGGVSWTFGMEQKMYAPAAES